MDLELLIANIVCCIGTVINVREVIRNRSILKGYPLVGSALTLTALFLFNKVFWQYGEHVSVAFGLVTVIYWLLVTLFLIKERIK